MRRIKAFHALASLHHVKKISFMGAMQIVPNFLQHDTVIYCDAMLFFTTRSSKWNVNVCL